MSTAIKGRPSATDAVRGLTAKQRLAYLLAEREFRRSSDVGGYCEKLGINLDPWQYDFLVSEDDRKMICAGRQSGKSTIAAIAALRKAIRKPGSLTLLLSPTLRQSSELFRKIHGFAMTPESMTPPITRESALQMELDTGSRIVSLPGGSESTVRGFTPDLVVIDEAAFVSDGVYDAIMPALAVSKGDCVLISSANFASGSFFDIYMKNPDWLKWTIKATENPRISAEFLAGEKKRMSSIRYNAEFMCDFISLDLVSVFSSMDVERAIAVESEWRPRIKLDF